MIQVNDASGILHDHALNASKASEQRTAGGGSVSLSLQDARERVLAETVYAPRDFPFFDNSAMDGFAVRLKDAQSGQALPIGGTIHAGDATHSLQPRTALRIFTGAAIPRGADCVIPVEDCREQNGMLHVSAPEALRPGQHLRRRGENIAAGTELLPRGTLLSTGRQAALASFGINRVHVHSPICVCIGVTGDEILAPDSPDSRQPSAEAGNRLHDTNGFLLRELCERAGCEASTFYIRDSRQDTLNFLQESAAHGDAVITSGGISMGDKDMLAHLVSTESHITPHIRKVAIKPGKPFTFATIAQKSRHTPLFCLPGNPLSVYITFQYFVLPYLRTLSGCTAPFAPQYPVSSPCDFTHYERTRFLFSRYETAAGTAHLSLLDNQSSANIVHLAHADGALIVPADSTIRKGDTLSFMPFDTA